MRALGSEWSARELGVAAVLVIASTALAILLGEVIVRALVHRDADGQEWLYDRRLQPYRLPQRQIAATLSRLQAGTSFLAYDPELGWSPRPGARSADGLSRVDAGGIRTDRDIPVERAAPGLRVALFGDSFTFGDEVGQEQTWGAALERRLADRGVAAEVLNFGANAYGMDQAYLRWRRDGRRYRPDVVVFGFQGEDVLRNVNVFRPLYFERSEVPLSKPRFVERGGALWYGDVFGDLARRHRLVSPLAGTAGADDPASFRPRGHYGPALNAAIGAGLAEPVLEAWRAAARSE